MVVMSMFTLSIYPGQRLGSGIGMVTFLFSDAFTSVLGHIQFPIKRLQLATTTVVNLNTQLRTMLGLRKHGAPPSLLHMPKWR